MLWLLIILLLGVVSLLYFFLYRDEEYEKIPGPKGIFPFGNAFDFFMDSGRNNLI